MLFEHRKTDEFTGENWEISFYDEFRVVYTQKLRVKSCFARFAMKKCISIFHPLERNSPHFLPRKALAPGSIPSVFSRPPPSDVKNLIRRPRKKSASPPILLQKHLYLPCLCPFYFQACSATLPYWMSGSDARIRCQNRIASSKNQKRNHYQMSEMKS